MRATEPSASARYSSRAGSLLLTDAPRAASAVLVASSTETEGVADATDEVSTNDEPNDVTFPSLLNATLATALAKGMPFCEHVPKHVGYCDSKMAVYERTACCLMYAWWLTSLE